MVLTARSSGPTNVASAMSVMTTTATQRRPPVDCCTFSRIGHVAMAIIVAHVSAPRNGNKIHKVPASSRARQITSNRMRATSPGAMSLICIAGLHRLRIHAHQACDEDGHEQLAGDAFDHRGGLGYASHGHDVTEARRGERAKA